MSDQPGQVEVAAVPARAHALVELSIPEFGKVLPPQVAPERFGRWALTTLNRGLTSPDDRQREAWAKVLGHEPGRLSVIGAFMDAASLGLEPGREYHLVPFGGLVTGITDYKGEIRLITNAERCSVVVRLVCAKDEFAMLGANVPPRHDTDWFGDRGEVIGGYAYVGYGSDRYSLVITMTEAEFLHHKAKAKTKNVWDEWPEPMRLKTLAHTLRKWVPWSAEWRAS